VPEKINRSVTERKTDYDPSSTGNAGREAETERVTGARGSHTAAGPGKRGSCAEREKPQPNSAPRALQSSCRLAVGAELWERLVSKHSAPELL
ncbi:hypothetical protein P7K49_036879, partial [Saguinus oedipus]